MKCFPLDCTTECPHFKTWDMSVDDWTSVCDILKVQVDDCDGDFIRYRCPLDSDKRINELPGYGESLEKIQKLNNKKIHELKILPEYFDEVRCGNKRFEIRKNDRNFHKGDILRLKEFDGKEYTGEEIDVLVRYVLYDWTGGLQDGYCIMSIDTMMHSIPRQEGR